MASLKFSRPGPNSRIARACSGIIVGNQKSAQQVILCPTTVPGDPLCPAAGSMKLGWQRQDCETSASYGPPGRMGPFVVTRTNPRRIRCESPARRHG